ncbi:MAG: hypothetical protein ACC661_08730, partial [Verrucomicrobiales bacterium]
TPYDLFLGLEKVNKEAKVDWGLVLAKSVAIVPEDYPATIPASLMLGVKIADGLIAIKAQSTEDLNFASESIEVLARTIGVSDDELVRAEKVRKMGVEGDWLGVFLELAFLQTDILQKLAGDESSAERSVILVGGWIQGARLSSYAIEANYSEEASGLLRQPELIADLIADLEGSGSEVSGNASIVEIIGRLRELRKICDIPMHGTMPLEKVVEMRKTCDELLEVIKNAK